MLPESEEECCWALLQHYISQIAEKNIAPQMGLQAGVMAIHAYCASTIYRQRRSNHFTTAQFDISELIGAYQRYNELLYRESDEEDAVTALNADVIASCQNWLRKYAV